MKLRLIMLLCFFSITRLNAQEVYYPKVGDKILNHTFTDLVNHTSNTFKISDYEGKWLVLDFWSRGCIGCIASFPKMDSLKQMFKNNVTFLMVGLYKDHGETITNGQVTKEIFKRRVTKYNLTLTSAFDSIAGEKYDIFGVPAIFVINPEGVIVAKTTKIDSNDLKVLLTGGSPSLTPSYSAHEKWADSTYNTKLPLLASGMFVNGGYDTAMIYRSVLMNWNNKMPEFAISENFKKRISNTSMSNTAEVIGQSLNQMFFLAYTGSTYWKMGDSLYSIMSRKIILEVNDKAPFIRRGKAIKNSLDTWAYSIKLPEKRASPQNFRIALLQDLHRALGVKSHIENREVEVYNLVVSDVNKLKKLRTKGTTYAFKQPTHLKAKEFYIDKLDSSVWVRAKDRVGFHVFNFPFSKFVKNNLYIPLDSKYKLDLTNVPAIIDKTGIEFNIDLDFDVDIWDWDKTLELLNKYGLDLVKARKLMKCIVLEDAY